MYDKIPQKYFLFFAFVGIILGAFLLWQCGARRGDDIGTGVDPKTITSGIKSAGADIGEARKEQLNAIDGISRAEIRVDNIEIQAAESRELIRECRESINRSQCIIRDILAGAESQIGQGTKKAPAN